jgi:ribosomal protein S18 acetylase RimI-like enzyme
LSRQLQVAVRTARSTDRTFVLDLADRLVAFDVPAWRPKPELVAGDRRALEQWFDARLHESSGEAGSAEEAMYVAELDGRPAGCAYLVTLIDYFNERPHAHLSVLAVSADAEGRGVGSALLDQSVAWAKQRGSDRLTLSALVTNSRARALYERKGFGGEYIRYVLPL